MPQIAFFDVDNTLMKGFSGFYSTLILIQKGILKKRRLPLAFFYRAVSPLYKGNLKKMYEIAVRDMAGSRVEQILNLGRECFERWVKPRLYREGIEKVEEHKKRGEPVYLMTSGPYMVIKILADFLGVDGRYSAGPVIDERGILTSEVRMPICYREGKVVAAEEVIRSHGASWKDCYYYADNIDDIYLLSKVGNPRVVNPDRRLLKIAKKRGWPVLNFSRLLKTLLVFLLPLVLQVGCQKAAPASEEAARRFMDNYYVKTDLRSASENADGFALEKIKKSLELTEGQAIDAAAHHPKISFSLLESRIDGIGGGEASYLFLVLIEPEKMSPVKKKTLVKVRERERGTWKVTQFSDYEMP